MKKTVKRADGEGSIYYNESKKLWCCTLQIGITSEGKPDRIYKYGKTQEEVRLKLVDLVHKYGTLKLSKDVTLNEWFPEWLFEYKDLSNGTRQNYLGIFKNHIEPYHIGKMKLSEITNFELKKYFNQLVRDGRSKQRITTIKNRLSTFFEDSLEYIPKNPMSGVQVPRAAKDNPRTYTNGKEIADEGKYNAFTVDEQVKLMDHIKNNSQDVFSLLFITIIGTGMRLGEAMALHWDKDILDDYSVIKVTRNLQRVPIFENRKVVRYELQEIPPKSEAGIRTIPLPDKLKPLLKKAHREYKLKARMDPYYDGNNLVFSDDIGDYIKSKQPLRKLRKLENELEISLINIHGLRHTYATRLFEAGEEIEVVSSLLGHSSVDITREVYVHILDERKKKVVEKINEFMYI